MRRMGIAAAMALGLALAAPGARAQVAPATGTAEVLYAVTSRDIEAIVAKIGFVTEIDTERGRVLARVFTNEDDRKAKLSRFNIALTVCNKPKQPPGCLGVMYVFAADIDEKEAARAQAFVAEFNSAYNFGRAYVDRNVLVMDYYIMTDNGLTAGNVEEVTREFDGLIGVFLEQWEKARAKS
jgi:hypothetical protein